MIALICNPAAKRAAQVLRVAASLDEVVVLPTTRDDSGPGQAREALRLGAERVLVAGGDGTVRAVAHELRGTGLPLGLVPVGTANIFARNLGLAPRRCAALVAELATSTRTRLLDVGVARWRTGEQWGQPQTFLVLAGIGHDAATVLGTTERAKRSLGWAAYLRSGARQLLSPPVTMRVELDDAAARDRQLWSLLAGNTARIPGGIEVFSGATPDDGHLTVVLCTVQRPHHWLAIGAKGLLHLRHEVPRLEQIAASRVLVRPSRAQPIQLDGDVFGPVDELEIQLHASALTVLVPERLP